ncbi:MAG: hypothetical protein LBR85_08945 [Oscillospiraceae bacterium]|jgi:uncharacterized HAD superfamily protein|nr:hypothetical protein [Oscillospiraceae bacterium]
MNIGIDVDGVLADVADYQLKIGTPYFKKKYGYDIVDPNAFDVTDIFGCTEEERRKFGWKTIWKYIIGYPARENASQVIRELRNTGHKTFIITGRVCVTQRNLMGFLSRFILRNWLKRRGIPYDGIFFCDEHHSARDKTEGCKKHRIDVMIEDKPENITALSKVTKVICFDCAYNKACDGKNIVRAASWLEIIKLCSM